MHGTAFKYFVEVAQAGSLSAASRRLHVAVSALSRQIARLEEEVGTPLFERAPRGMVPSEAGRLLLAHARRMLLESESVMAQIAALKEAPRDVIRVGASEGPARGFVPVAMTAFRKRHPNTRFDLRVVTPGESLRDLSEGEIDLAVTFNVEPVQGVTVLHSWRAPVHAVMAAEHPLARRKVLRLKDVLAYPLALTDGRSTARTLLERSCALAGRELAPFLVSNYSPSLHGFVRHSDAIMFAGYLSVAWRLEQDGLAARPMDCAELQSRNLLISTMQGRLLPPLVASFIDYLKQEVDKAEAGWK